MEPTLTIALFGVGAAALAFWAVARFPGFGPKSVLHAMATAAAMFVLQTPLLGLVTPTVARIGVPGALLLIVLPSLTLLFWASGCLVRSLVSLAAPYRR